MPDRATAERADPPHHKGCGRRNSHLIPALKLAGYWCWPMKEDHSDPTVVKQWRQRASELRAMAEHSRDQFGKRSLLMLANGYDAMAYWHERQRGPKDRDPRPDDTAGSKETQRGFET